MLDELVLVAEAVLVQHPVIVQHDGVVHRPAEREVARAHELEVADETEGPRAADFPQEGRRREVHAGALAVLAEDRVLELDLEVDLEALVGLEARPLVAVPDFDRLADAHETLRRGLLLDAGGLHQEHERSGAAIHDRHFRRGELDERVVDAQAGERRQQVFHRRHLGVTHRQRGAERRLGDVGGARRDVDRVVEVGAAEDDADVVGRGPENQQHLAPRVQPHTGGPNRILQRSLLHDLALADLDITSITLVRQADKSL